MDDPASSAASSAPPADAESTGDLLYDAFYGAAIGGATIALFFLVADIIQGRPMFTPSLMGEVLFMGADPGAVSEVRFDMVAYFTIVHLVSFLVLGGAISYLCRATGIAKTNMPVVIGVVFVILTAAFFAGDFLLMSGVAAVIGIPSILAANFVTALAMGLFLRRAHA